MGQTTSFREAFNSEAQGVMKVYFEQLSVFNKYRGDDDGFARSSTERERSVMKNFNWGRLSALLQSMALVRDGLVTPELEQETLRQIHEMSGDRETLKAFLIEMNSNKKETKKASPG